MIELPPHTPDFDSASSLPRYEAVAHPYAPPRLVVHGDAGSLTVQVSGRGTDGPIS